VADRININSVVFTGRLTRDPELRGPGSDEPSEVEGKPVWAILAVGTNKRTSNGGSRPVYIDVKVWNGAARFFVDKAHKGSFVAVEGSLDQYDNPEGSRWHFVAGENVELITT